jgi:hypothetical protein
VSQDSDTYFLEMTNDLEAMPLKDVIKKWKQVFTDDINFAISLAKQMFKEYKF